MSASTPIRACTATAKGSTRSAAVLPFPGFRNALVGQSPLNIEGIWERIRTSGIFGGAQAGQYVATLTAVEIALWDLAGKALNMPIYS